MLHIAVGIDGAVYELISYGRFFEDFQWKECDLLPKLYLLGSDKCTKYHSAW